ncbi:MAG: AraC family transcriptional regulator [Bryobacteraceae bacterium]|nr:AraC family transcriptional regulator [Bryobacteraceae bacterium]
MSSLNVAAISGMAIVAAQCALTATLLMRDQQVRGRRLWALPILFGLLAWLATWSLLGHAGLSGDAPALLKAVVWASVLLLPPSVYFFVSGLSMGARPGSAADLLHAAPALLFLLLLALPLTRSPVNRPTAESIIRLLWYALALQAVPYLFAGFRLLRHDRGRLWDQISFQGSPEQARTRFMLFALTLPWASFVLELLAVRITGVDESLRVALGLFRLSGTYLFAVFALQPHSLLTEPGIMLPHTVPLEDGVRPGRYARSVLEPQSVDRIAARLETAMEQDFLYRRPLLALRDVAEHIAVPEHKVSQVLNSRLKCNFFDFVNEWRVREARQRLRDEPGTPVLTIAMDVGFNSKSTFNSAFQRFTRMTPSAYRRDLAAGSGAGKREPDLRSASPADG